MIHMINTVDEAVQGLGHQILDTVFCNLVDAGFDPGQAYEATYLSDFDLGADVDEYPNDDLVDEDVIYEPVFDAGQ